MNCTLFHSCRYISLFLSVISHVLLSRRHSVFTAQTPLQPPLARSWELSTAAAAIFYLLQGALSLKAGSRVWRLSKITATDSHQMEYGISGALQTPPQTHSDLFFHNPSRGKSEQNRRKFNALLKIFPPLRMSPSSIYLYIYRSIWVYMTAYSKSERCRTSRSLKV